MPDNNIIVPTNNYPVVLSIRATRALRDHVRQTAQDAGMSISRYCRERLAGHRIAAKADQQVRSELRQLGGLLKQLWSQGMDTGPTLQKINQALDRI